MKTPTVPTVTEEFAAELEAAANAATPGPWGHIRINDISWVASEDWEILDLRCDKPLDAEDGEFIAMADPEVILALLAERADLKQQLAAAAITAENCELFRRDAERYRWLRDPDRVPDDDPCGNLIVGQAEGEDILWHEELDRFIDAARAIADT